MRNVSHMHTYKLQKRTKRKVRRQAELAVTTQRQQRQAHLHPSAETLAFREGVAVNVALGPNPSYLNRNKLSLAIYKTDDDYELARLNHIRNRDRAKLDARRSKDSTVLDLRASK